MAGEYTGAVMLEGLRRFLADHMPSLLESSASTVVLTAGKSESPMLPRGSLAKLLATEVPARPPGLCTGCPERPLFTSMKLLQREIGDIHISADIGCHSFATLPPFDLGASIMGYGLGAAGSAALNAVAERRPISLMGDGGFWHNGLTSGIGNAVFNRHDGVTVIVDNGYSAATGGQYIPSSHGHMDGRKAGNPIENAVRGVGVEWVRRVQTYNMKQTLGALREAMKTPFRGPKVIIAEGECQLNRQRRIAPILREREAAGVRIVKQRFGIDDDVCSGDHSCIRLSGCPSLTLKPSTNPLRQDPVAHVDESCVGCGVCGEVAHVAVLCPSFYRTDVIANPTRWDRGLARFRHRVISWLSHRSKPVRS